MNYRKALAILARGAPPSDAAPHDASTGPGDRFAVLRRWPCVAAAAAACLAAALAYEQWAAHESETIFPGSDRLTLEKKLCVIVPALAVVGFARAWPRLRDEATLVIGVGFAFWAYGWEHVVVFGTITALAHFVLRKLAPWPSMLLAACALLALESLYVPAYHFLPEGAAWAGVRIVYYAYEASAVPAKKRSIVRALAYGPFNMLMAPGNPPMLSYLTYSSDRSRTDLDALGARQLFRAAAKLVLFCIVTYQRLAQTPGVSWFLHPYVILYLAWSAEADFTSGLSNWSGYYAPDAFDNPFVSASMFDFWQRWNVHVLFFLRQAFILPVARKKRSLLLCVIAGMTGTWLVHQYFGAIGWRSQPELSGLAKYVFYNTLVFLPFIKLDPKAAKWSPGARFLLIVGVQLLLAWIFRGGPAQLGGEILAVLGVPTS
jgi:hypothetical protein